MQLFKKFGRCELRARGLLRYDSDEHLLYVLSVLTVSVITVSLLMARGDVSASGAVERRGFSAAASDSS